MTGTRLKNRTTGWQMHRLSDTCRLKAYIPYSQAASLQLEVGGVYSR